MAGPEAYIRTLCASSDCQGRAAARYELSCNGLLTFNLIYNAVIIHIDCEYQMELRHIRYFLAIAEEQSFTRAASKLGLGQPPLSQQIKAMEEEIGVRLFRRLSHGVELTEAGRAFHARVADLPNGVLEGVKLARKAASGETGQIRLGFTGSGALHPVVATCIRAFSKSYPDVELVVTETNSFLLAKAIAEDRLDVAILRPSATNPLQLNQEVLIDEPFVVALPKCHPLAQESGALDPKQLENEPFIFTPREVGTSFHDATLTVCADAGFVPQLSQSATQISSILSLVAAELGVSLLPACISDIRAHGVVFRPLKNADVRVSLALASRRGTTAILVRNFLQVARIAANPNRVEFYKEMSSEMAE